MAFKFIVLFGLLAAVNAGDLTHGYIGYAPSIQKTIEYASAPVAKTIEYAAPAITKTIYQPSPILAKTVYEPEYHHHNYHAQPYHQAPSYHGTISHYGKTIATPHSYVNKYDTRIINDDAHNYNHYNVAAYPMKTLGLATAAAPIVKSYHSVDHSYDHGYDHSYAHGHAAHPVIAIPKAAAISYSPSVAVSHASFENAHGHYGW